MAKRPYNTQENTEKQRRYRDNHREQYTQYQREYKQKNYGSPTLRLAQVRLNIRNAQRNLQKWIEEEAELLTKQKEMQAARDAVASKQPLDQWMQAVVNE